MLKSIYFICISVLLPFISFAQQFSLSGKIKNAEGKPLSNVSVEILKTNITALTSDEFGYFMFSNLTAGTYEVRFSHIGFKPILRTYKLDDNRITEVVFQSQEINIDEVFVTAKESRNISTSSIISKEAMQHLQPSSFSDILELLPGGRAATPDLIKGNPITLRGFSSSNANYQTHSMGTLFQVDGMNMNSIAGLSSLEDYLSSGNSNSSRDMTTRGVDMRSISTDNIEQVEIIRGVPSAEYGDITSGVVLIERKKGYEPWSTRVKTDGFSKLFSVGKGFEFNHYKLNIDGGYLHANSNPTDVYTSYKRVNASVRGEKTWILPQYRLLWGHSLDLGTTIDNDRFDPDNDYFLTDFYKAGKRQYSFGNSLEIFSTNPKKQFKSAKLIANFSMSDNYIDMEKLVQISAVEVLANSMISGSQEAKFFTPTYVSKLKVDDKPIQGQLKLLSNWQVEALVKHQLKAGLEYTYAKNIGKGSQYDLDFPMNTGVQTRPRVFHDIPARSNLAVFAEDRFFIPLGKFLFENSVGLRAFTLTNLPREHQLNNQIAIDPRWNGRLHLPKIGTGTDALKSSISVGFGQQSLAPNISQLSPNVEYRDIVELSYYHNNPDYRLAWVNTNRIDPTNLNLSIAKNKKWEISSFLELNGNTLSLTYFNEQMTSGFRQETKFDALEFRKYTVSSVDPNTLTSKPSISDFKYTDEKEFRVYSQNANGSIVDKRGLEYQFSSQRIKGINTRFTLNGAWFRQELKDAQSLARMISQLIVTNGKVRQYVGIYDDLDGSLQEMFNTNIMADSYLPKLGLKLSISIQNIWFSSRQQLPRNSLPTGYYTIDNQLHPYLPSDVNDVNLRHLDQKLDDVLFLRYTEPINLQANFKATKSIKDKIMIAMFVNQLFIYRPDYTQYGFRYYRQNNHVPYFGMELNIKI